MSQATTAIMPAYGKDQDMPLVAVTAIGKDRPGIVAAVTKVLFDIGCNLEDVSSTILRGHFSMMLVVQAPEGFDTDELQVRLRAACAPLGLVVTASPVDEIEAPVSLPTHMVSVYGADHPGIVYKVSERICERGGNITDLTSRVIGDDRERVYALMLEVSAPDHDLQAELKGLAGELGVDITVRPIEADIL